MQEYAALIREFGFPVFVALWFMLRLEAKIDRMFELMNSLMQASALLAKSLDDRNHQPALRVLRSGDGTKEGTDP